MQRIFFIFHVILCRFDLETGEVVGVPANTTGKIGTLSEDAFIAYRLICSAGHVYSCAGRVRFMSVLVEFFIILCLGWKDSSRRFGKYNQP